MRNVFDLYANTHVLPDDPYVASYPHLLEYFSQLKDIKQGDVVRGAHMIYGWMPTILGLNLSKEEDTLQVAARLLARAKSGQELNGSELQSLSDLVNRSMVGASKLLHFVAPRTYPIWDSRVYRFVHEETAHHYRVNSVSAYQKYVTTVRQIADDSRISELRDTISSKLGYSVSEVRAIELVMFCNAPPSGA